MIYSFTVAAAVKFALGFSAPAMSKDVENEENFRLVSIFSKNKYGYNTRFMSDFELLLESVLNEKFLDQSLDYYTDELTATEVEDEQVGLAGDFAPADVAQLLHDKSDHDHSSFKSLRHPDRVGTNYPKGDALSCYKILPKQ